MNLRARRAVASVGILIFLIVYVWVVIAIGDHVSKHPLAQLAYFGLAGTLWGVPLLPLMSWSEGKPFLRSNARQEPGGKSDEGPDKAQG